MNATSLNLLLADDDLDDCRFFREALEELPVEAHLITVNDGVQLMQLLAEKEEAFPDVFYLDLNMPRKNGFECLTEIKQDKKLKRLPVIIFSTSFNPEAADRLYEDGAHYYIRKPAEFLNLKKILLQSINLISDAGSEQPEKEKFVLTPA